MAGRMQELYEHVVRLNRRWRMLTMRKVLYLPRILSAQEKRLYVFLSAALLLSGATFFARTYAGLTRPVPQIGSSYTEGVMGVPEMINPLYAVKDADRDISRLVFSGLFTYDGAGVLQPDLAERYEVSADGKVYTVIMRNAAVWHDGVPLTADDVVFTVKRIQNVQYKSPFRLNWQGVEAEKVDDHTARFTLRTAYAPFIENLTQGIIPKHLWEHTDPSAALLHSLNLNPVGSGPYIVKRFKSDGAGSLLWYTLSRNANFHREGPYLKEITFVFFNNEEDMIAAWHRGDIEGFGPVSSLRANEFSKDAVQVLALATPRIFSVFFNEKQAPVLLDKKIRTAIAYAIDRERIAEQATTGGGIAMTSLLPISRPFADAVPALEHGSLRARELIESAGWKDADGDGIYEKTMKNKTKTETTVLEFGLTTGDSPELVRAASLIKEMLAEAGIRVTIDARSFADLESAVIRPRNFQMLLFGQVYGYEPDPFAFWHSSQSKDPGLNIAFFAHRSGDKILETARRTIDAEKRAALYGDFARIAAAEIPAVPLYTQMFIYLLPRDIQGVALSRIALPSDRFNEINAWYRETQRVLR